MSTGHHGETSQRTDQQSDAALTALGPDYARLVAAALPYDGAFATLGHITDIALGALRDVSHDSAVAAPATPPRRSGAVVDEFERARRDAERERILVEMAQATPDHRRFLIARALDLHSRAERQRLRQKATFEMREAIVAHYGGMSDRAIASHILADLRRRVGEVISSTGSRLRDRLCDRIIAANGDVPSERTVREEIRPRRFGQNL